MNRTTGSRLSSTGLHEEVSVSSTGSAIIGGEMPHHSDHPNHKRNMTVTQRRSRPPQHTHNAASMASYGRGQFNVLDTSDQNAVDKAAAMLASDDFLETYSSQQDYGAPTELFTASIRPNSPNATTKLSSSTSLSNHQHQFDENENNNNDDDDSGLWAARSKRGGMTRNQRGASQSTPALGSLHEQVTQSRQHSRQGGGEKRDDYHEGKKNGGALTFGKGETPLAVSKSMDGTWHQVGIVAAPYERPATRREVLELEHRYTAICEFARLATVKESGGGGGGIVAL